MNLKSIGISNVIMNQMTKINGFLIIEIVLAAMDIYINAKVKHHQTGGETQSLHTLAV